MLIFVIPCHQRVPYTVDRSSLDTQKVNLTLKGGGGLSDHIRTLMNLGGGGGGVK